MVSPEGGGNSLNQEHESALESDPVPYHRSVQFADDSAARAAYVQAQETVFNATPDCELSVYRFLLNQIPHVTVLGDPPPTDLATVIDELLAGGEPVELPRGVLIALAQRRQQATQHGQWVEGHHRPGARIELPPE